MGLVLSDVKIAAYGRMTPEERWREVEELMTLAWRDLLARSTEERERVLRHLREEHDKSDAVMLAALRRLG
jgi:hypothetical protein